MRDDDGFGQGIHGKQHKFFRDSTWVLPLPGRASGAMKQEKICDDAGANPFQT
jgi:hypothetical protein